MLEIIVTSFSFKKGLPADDSGHGGGFIFDCRCLPNPGRESRFAKLSGRDKEVSDYLAALPETDAFFGPVRSLVEQAITNYTSRGFSYLSVGFGCTGGQHRSVFFAEKLARELRSNSEISVRLNHRELASLGLAGSCCE